MAGILLVVRRRRPIQMRRNAMSQREKAPGNARAARPRPPMPGQRASAAADRQQAGHVVKQMKQFGPFPEKRLKQEWFKQPISSDWTGKAVPFTATMETAMPLRGRVGRHTQSGRRQCQNWLDDQNAVIALLNRIPMDAGGAEGSLDGRLNGRMVAGMASDSLYAAIARFEDTHFPRQRSGFVDPGGRMLRRMEELAARVPALPTPPPLPAPPSITFTNYLDLQRRKVLDESRAKLFSSAEKAAFQPLVDMAVQHIDHLKNDLGMIKLPWPVELFGRAHITKDKRPAIDKGGSLIFDESGHQQSPAPAASRNALRPAGRPQHGHHHRQARRAASLRPSGRMLPHPAIPLRCDQAPDRAVDARSGSYPALLAAPART